MTAERQRLDEDRLGRQPWHESLHLDDRARSCTRVDRKRFVPSPPANAVSATALRLPARREGTVQLNRARSFQEFGAIDILVSNAVLQRVAAYNRLLELIPSNGSASGTTLFVDGGMTLYPGP